MRCIESLYMCVCGGGWLRMALKPSAVGGTARRRVLLLRVCSAIHMKYRKRGPGGAELSRSILTFCATASNAAVEKCPFFYADRLSHRSDLIR